MHGAITELSRVKTQAKSVIARYKDKGIHMGRNVYIYTYAYISTFCLNHCYALQIAQGFINE